MNITLMKTVDAFIGRLLTLLLPIPPRLELNTKPCSVLLIRPGGIGDAVLLAPAITLLKKSYPDIQITVLAEQRNAGAFALILAVDQVWCYDRPAEFWQVVRNRYDVVIDTEQWHRLSAVVARLVRASVKIGFATNERRRMFTDVVTYSHDDYEVTSFNRLLVPLGVAAEPACEPPFLVVPPDARKVAERLLEPFAGRPFVTIFAGASIPERRWGAERFKAVGEALVQQGYGVCVVGGAVDQADGAVIAGSAGLNLAGCTSLAETAAVLARSALLVSGDSGLLHIAVGLDLPTVSLFGPGRSLKWAPVGSRHIVINKSLACSPCTTFGTTPPCPHDLRCMQEITVSEVITACLASLLHPAS